MDGRKLSSGAAQSCGCGRKPPLKEWVGKRFGRVVVLEYAGKENGHHMWRCRCDCGREFIVNQSNLQNGQTTSCGCKQKERTGLHFAEGIFVEGRASSQKLSLRPTPEAYEDYFNKRGASRLPRSCSRASAIT